MPHTLADLSDFLTALRVNGIPSGPRDLDRLRQLFALQPNLDRQGLQSLLRALLVKTPEQRQTFEALFADWCPDREATWPEDTVHVPEPPPVLEPQPPPLLPEADQVTPALQRHVGKPVWLLLSGIALLALLLWGLWPRPVVIMPPEEPTEVAAQLPPETPSRPNELPATPVEKVWFWQAHVP